MPRREPTLCPHCGAINADVRGVCCQCRYNWQAGRMATQAELDDRRNEMVRARAEYDEKPRKK